MKTIVSRMILVSLLAATMPLMSAPSDAEAAAQLRAAGAQAPDTFRFEITTMRARVGVALQKLQLLQKNDADLPALFKDYRADVTEMAKLGTQTASRAEEMKKQDMAFFRAWEQRADTILDPEIQKLATGRYDRRLKSYRKMVASMEEVRLEFVPFLDSLRDIEKLLASDLSRNSIQSVQKFFRAVRLKGADLEDDLYDVIVEEGRVAAEFGRYQ